VLAPANGSIYDVQVSAGYAWVAGDRLASISLNDLVTHLAAGDACGNEGALALGGQFAFTAMQNCFGDAEINVWDISTPSAPRYVRSQGVGGINLTWRGLTTLGTSYLIAFTPDRPSGIGHDIAVIDRTNVNNLTKISELEIANFDAIDGVVDGSTLYVAGGDGGVAIVDMINPFSPALKSTIRSIGTVRSVAVTGTNQIAFADGTGITFVDTTDKANPIIIGRQPLPGVVAAVTAIGKSIYVGAENYYHLIQRP
jgi:hypothetical protein